MSATEGLRLHGHRGQSVEIDHCRACRQVCFDALESVHLSGLGWIELLREMAPGRPAADGGPDPLPEVGERPALACPRCAEPLKPVHNQTRWGRFPALECPRQHGHLQGDAGLLAERGLVRPLLPAEWRALEDERRTLGCLACGAAAQCRQADCAWCGSPLLVLDLPRLAHALRQRMGHWTDLPSPAGTPLPWPNGVYAQAKLAGSPRVYWQTHETNHTAMQLYDKVADKPGFVIYRKII